MKRDLVTSVRRRRSACRCYTWTAALSLALPVTVGSTCAQGLLGQEGEEEPLIVPQSESVKIEPYEGPPIFLPDPPEAVPAQRVETTSHTDYYDEETKEKPRIKRSIARYSDDSVKSHGVYQEFYENGQIFVEGRFEEGVPAGDWKYFHENGSEAKTVTFENGVPTGEIEVRRPDGTLKAKRQFVGGQRDGTWMTYDESGDNPLTEQHYDQGQADGVWQSWFANGNKRQQSPFEDGKRHGTVIEWDEEGNKRAEVSFVKGERHGLSRIWTADGQAYEQEYEEGKLVATRQVEE